LLIATGFQSPGTLGDKIFNQGVKQFKYENFNVKVNCDLFRLKTFSGHADQEDLLYFIKQLKFKK